MCKDVDDVIRCLPREDAQTFIDVVDEVRCTSTQHRRSTHPAKSVLTHSVNQALEMPDLSPWARNQCLRPLYRTCGRHALLPKTMEISVCYDRTSDTLYSGGYADVWKGQYHGRDVAVKVIRTYSSSNLEKVIGVSC